MRAPRALCALVVGLAVLSGCGSSTTWSDTPAEEQIVEDVEDAMQYWRDRAGIEWSGEALGRLAENDAPAERDDHDDWYESEIVSASGTNTGEDGARAVVRYTSHVAAYDDSTFADQDIEEETITRCVEIVVGASGSLHDGSWDWTDCPD